MELRSWTIDATLKSYRGREFDNNNTNNNNNINAILKFGMKDDFNNSNSNDHNLAVRVDKEMIDTLLFGTKLYYYHYHHYPFY